MTDLAKLHAGMSCDVCGTMGVVGVASSCLGPISHAFCRTCLMERAEPLGMLAITKELCEGNVADWVKEQVRTFHEGKYLSWNEADEAGLLEPK